MYSELIGESSVYTGTSYTRITGIVTGTEYSVKVAAKNRWGVGEFSDAIMILAASEPEKISSVVTTIDPATGGV